MPPRARSPARACRRYALLACVLGAALAHAAAPAPVPLAHSALLAVDVAPAAGGLELRVRPATGQTALLVSDVAVRIDNQSAPATARPDGGWFLARPAGAQDGGKPIEVTVGHDGIHEVLSGRVPASLAGEAAPGSAAGTVMSSSRKQLFWWILNIGIVLVAVLAISRRMS
ncbi:MAG: hypothetical protein JO184_20295 [Gammaproteobacteria bacterium]|nr:hypothetical protein [Gammaproteobacteria bacterium]